LGFVLNTAFYPTLLMRLTCEKDDESDEVPNFPVSSDDFKSDEQGFIEVSK